MNMDMTLYDLHTHSKVSDGSDTPVELVNKAYHAGISVLALTDHDTVAGCSSAAAEAKKLGMRFLPGVEISGKEYSKLHILGIGIDTDNKDLKDALDKCAASRSERTYHICEYLSSKGVILDPEKINSTDGNVGKPHIAKEMIARGYVSTVKEAFDKYLESPEIDKIKKYKLGYMEAADLIHGAGGKVVLAHPYQMKLTDQQLDDFIYGFNGLDAIEVFYSRHTPEMASFYLTLADKYGLKISIGSDYHGTVKPDISLGTGCDDSLLKLREQYRVDDSRLVFDGII